MSVPALGFNDNTNSVNEKNMLISLTSKEKFENTYKNVSIEDFCLELEKISNVNYSQEEIKLVTPNVHKNVHYYLTEILKDKSEIQNYILRIIEAQGKLDLQYNEVFNSTSGTATWRYGDILYYPPWSTNSGDEKSTFGHVAVLSTTNNYVIEATRTVSNGNKVFHWSSTHLWNSNCSNMQQYKVANWFGTDATVQNRLNAVDYGLQQVNKPYSLQTDLYSTNIFYCSKLVKQMWAQGGVNLTPISNYINSLGYLFILPNDIAADANMYLIKHWGSTTPVAF